MKKYLKRFNNHSQYEEYKESTALVRPSVSQCVADDDVHYYPEFHFPYEEYVEQFEDPIVWETCCNNWGDFYEIDVTTITTPNGEGSTVKTTMVKKMVSMLNATKLSELVLWTSVTTEESSEIVESATTATTINKTPIGITLKQIQAITSFGEVFNNKDRNGSVPLIKKFNELQLFTGLTTIASAFRFQELETVILPPNLKELSPYAFNWCDKLTNLVINEGCERISIGALWECRTLEVIKIPSTVTQIDGLVIQITGHRYGYNVLLLPTTPPTYNGDTSYTYKLLNLYVPDESLETYKANEKWSVFADKFKPKSELPDDLKKYWP